jgi:hypothetical protein
VDVCRCQAHQAGNRLGEQDDERAGDAVAWIQRLVAEQPLQDVEALFCVARARCRQRVPA